MIGDAISMIDGLGVAKATRGRAGIVARRHRCRLDVEFRDIERISRGGRIEFFRQTVMIACDESMVLAAQLIDLRDDWNWRVADRRADSASRKLVTALIGTPVVTVNQVRHLLGVPFLAANNAVADFGPLGILTGTAGEHTLERRRTRKPSEVGLRWLPAMRQQCRNAARRRCWQPQ